ncbi:MAG TPA: hypothetical protein DCZ72_05245 [Armatimonadetes bacterium]|nr:hypothetical protein [Armatimonadota bacterium]
MSSSVSTIRSGLLAAQQGHDTARDEVAQRLWPRLRSLARYYARRTGEDADDLLSEAWVGLLEGLAVVDVTIGDPEQYLLARARWRVLDHVRRTRLRRLESLEAAGTLPAAADGHERRLGELALHEFLAQLSTTQRAIAECLLDGLTWRQTGEVLGCTSANVAYHMRQIRARWRAWCVAERAEAD